MSSLLYRLGRACALHYRRVFAFWGASILAVGLLTVLFGGQMRDTFEIPGSEGMIGMETLNNRFPELAGMTADVLLQAPEGGRIDDHPDDVHAVLAQMAQVPTVIYVTDPLDATTRAVSEDNRYALATVQIDGTMGNLDPALVPGIEAAAVSLPNSPVTVHLGGSIYDTTSVHISPTEVLGVAVALIALTISFGSLIPAGLPILTALVGVALGLFLVLIAAAFTDIITTTPTLALMIGLAVGIDYALFILHRHRAELAGYRGTVTREGIAATAARATATAGSSVVFAGVTVIIALCGLFVAGLPFITLMGIASAITVGIAVFVALTLIPAIAGALGPRLVPRGRARRLAAHGASGTMGARWVRLVTRAPLVTVLVVTAGLLALTYPAKDLALTLPNNSWSAPGSPDRITYELITQEFGPGANNPLVVTADIIRSTDPLGQMEAFGAEIASLPGVERVVIATPNRMADLGVVVLQPTTGQADPATGDLVATLREQAPTLAEQYGFTNVLVTGTNAVSIDVVEKTGDAMIPFGIVVVGLSFLLLMLVFRSIWVPLKAALGYVLSVGGALGATTMVFQYGWGADLIKVQQVGPVISFFPIILMGVLFGLAMDYEVFLVSRMREDYVHSGDARGSVRTGFAASARVVTTAAVIMIAVFAFFVPESDLMVKPIAFGLAVGVALDAFVVRMTLVPAIMTLLGDRAWWLPRWLDRRLPHLDVEGEGLVHHLAHEQWTLDHGTASIRAEGLTIRDGDGEALVENVSLFARAGDRLDVASPDHVARRALLAAIAGRLAADNHALSGELFVLDYMLPDEATAVRTRSLLLFGRPGLPPGALDGADGARLVVVDAELTVAEDTRLAALARRGVTVVVGMHETPGGTGADGTDAELMEVSG